MKNEQVARELIKTKKVIREKLRALKEGNLDRDHTLQTMFEPVTKPLQQVVSELGEIKKRKRLKDEEEQPQPLKREKIKSNLMETPEREYAPASTSTPHSSKPKQPSFLTLEDIGEISPEHDDDDYNDDDGGDDVNQSIHTKLHHPTDIKKLIENDDVFEEYLDQFNELPASYIKDFIIKQPSLGRYGVRLNLDDGKFRFGDSEVDIIGDNIIIKGKEYTGSPGLYQLLFSNEPTGTRVKDEENFKDIIERTYAAHRKYDANKQRVGFNHQKYRKFVKPKLPSRGKPKNQKRLGKGMLLDVNNNNKDFVYWDDPNEIVDRLRLLCASQAAGNNNHNNEIVSIIEELKEADIIE